MEPDSDIEVELFPRKRYEVGQCAFSLKDSGKIFAVVAEASGVASSRRRRAKLEKNIMGRPTQ